MLNSTPVLVFLRLFTLPILLIVGYLAVFDKPGGHQAHMDALIAPYLASITTQLGSMGNSASAYVAPIANAKFTSGRTMNGSTLTLSGGSFIRP